MKIYYEANKLYRYFNHTLDNQNEETIHDLLTFAENYLNLATLQMKRIRSIDEKLTDMQGRITKPEHQEVIRLYFGDIHFFFCCAFKFLQFSCRLATMMNWNTKNDKDFDTLYEYYRKIRNHFEHIDERIENHPFFRKDISCTMGDKMVVQDIEYDLTEKALIPLYTIYETILTKINELIEPKKSDIDLAWETFDKRFTSN